MASSPYRQPRPTWAGQCVPFALLVVMLLGTLCWGAQGLSDVQKQQLRVHQQLLESLTDGRFSVEQQYKMVYGLVAKANALDRDRNRKVAETLASNARELRERNEARAQELLKAAQAYKRYSEINQQIVHSFEQGTRAEVDRAISELLKLGEHIQKLTGQPAPREWFTPREVEAMAVKDMLARREAQQQQQQKKAQ